MRLCAVCAITRVRVCTRCVHLCAGAAYFAFLIPLALRTASNVSCRMHHTVPQALSFVAATT